MTRDQETEIDLSIERLGIHGEGIGRLEGFTYFVEGALPGEEVQAEICEKKRSFARARLIALRSTSTHRVKPPCSVFGKCGGCQLMHLEYAQQLEAKRVRVRDALQRIGKFQDVVVLPCIPSPLPLAYRNKIQLSVGKNGSLALYTHQTHDRVEIEKCHIHCALGEKALHHIRHLLKTTPLTQIIVKSAIRTQEVLVILVTEQGRIPTTLAQALTKAMPEIKGVIQKTDAQFYTLTGQSWIEEKLCGLSFKISPASFLQVNIPQAEQVYAKVIELLELTDDQVVLDAYCGVGTLSLILAQHAKKVIGIESVPEAVLDARENAQRNQIENATFICGRAETSIDGLQQLDSAVLNPPRIGCEQHLLKKIIELRPKRIVYISCDPATLARDLQILCNQGYFLDTVQPFDMFPQTAHVECVVRISRA